MKDIDFAEFEKVVFEKATEHLKDKNGLASTIAKISANVATIAIREYHAQLILDQSNQKATDE